MNIRNGERLGTIKKDDLKELMVNLLPWGERIAGKRNIN